MWRDLTPPTFYFKYLMFFSFFTFKSHLLGIYPHVSCEECSPKMSVFSKPWSEMLTPLYDMHISSHTFWFCILGFYSIQLNCLFICQYLIFYLHYVVISTLLFQGFFLAVLAWLLFQISLLINLSNSRSRETDGSFVGYISYKLRIKE